MDLQEQYNRLRDGTFLDEEVAELSGIHPRSLRDLSKWGALKKATDERGTGKKRLWTGVALRRAACIAALLEAGIALPLAARINFYFWIDMTLINTLRRLPRWDWLQNNPARDHPVHHLLDPQKKHIAPNKYDVAVRVVNRELIFLHGRLKAGGTAHSKCIGRLLDQAQDLLVWDVLPRRLRVANFRPKNPTYSIEESEAALADAWASWTRDITRDYGHEIDEKFLDYREDPGIDKKYARQLSENPKNIISVNLTLAMKISIRKALALPTVYP